MKERKSILFICLFIIISLIPSLCFSQAYRGGKLISVEIDTEKEILHPGDVIKVTLSGFKARGNEPVYWEERVVITVEDGWIMEGATPSVAWMRSLMADEKAFVIGKDGKVEFAYRAPLRCKKNRIKIKIYDSPAIGDIDINETEKEDEIGVKTLQLICGKYALLEYEDKLELDDGYRQKNQNVHVILRLDFQPFGGPNMMVVTSANVIWCSGTAEWITKDDELRCILSGYHDLIYNPVTHLFFDPGTGNLMAAVFGPMRVPLNWIGDEIPFTPMKAAKVERVSDYDNSVGAIEKAAEKLQRELKEEGMDSKTIQNRINELKENLKDSILFPDDLVIGGNEKTFFQGKGTWEEKNQDGTHTKLFKWELYFN